MIAKRFTLIIDSEWWIVEDNSIKSNKYRNDLDGDDAYRGLKEGELTEKEVVDLLNELHEENEYLCEKIKENEWHWNTIDEDRDVWMYKCKRLEEENGWLKERIKELEE